jgi:hypothetical protein
LRGARRLDDPVTGDYGAIRIRNQPAGRQCRRVVAGLLTMTGQKIRCGFVLPGGTATEQLSQALLAGQAGHGAAAGLDMISEGETPAAGPAAAATAVAPWAQAGCTWWLGTRWELPHDSEERLQQVHERLSAGPPLA